MSADFGHSIILLIIQPKAWRKSQAKLNRLTVQLANQAKELADATNRAPSTETSTPNPAPTTCKSKCQYLSDPDQRIQIEKIAKKFTYMNMLWLRHIDELFRLEVDQDYQPENRFKSIEDGRQGVLAELRQAIPA